MENKFINVIVGSNKVENTNKIEFAKSLRESQIPDAELLDNMGVYLTRQNLSRIFMIQKLYEMIVPVHGVIMEFGVRWGQNLSLLNNLRGIYEPYNYNRKIIGFDTFGGFPEVDAKDGTLVKAGDYSVTSNYEDALKQILEFHEQNAPIPHKKKHELVIGNANQTLPAYLKSHPETIIAFAYFDFDIYEPTKNCLQAILPHVTKGTVIAFDELNCPEFPGETIALKEVIGLSKYAIRRFPNAPLVSYIVIE